ncbi:glycosyl transferase family 17 [Candidatus Pelagibacter sp. HIMB123]|uniref:glycosyl transferase family 17 n=1 Tax=Candidatus Pelagibacter sp. HIMB123 TaxID=3415413 RepID=UPI003F87D08B
MSENNLKKKSKIFDCITFFKENFISNIRFEILNDMVDYFVICESIYDHRGKKKKLNFKLLNEKFRSKIIYVVLEERFKSQDLWKNQAQQREYIFEGLKLANDNDYIMFSDPDEIPNPEKLRNLNLQNTYGIFLQDCFCYKINLFNKYESPWEGTRICKKRNLKSINHMRQNVKLKNLKYKFFRLDKERNIQIIDNGGWHFNNLMTAEDISLKLKTFAHSEFSGEEFSSVNIIKEKINKKIDLFNRGHTYEVLNLDKKLPNYILKNLDKFKDYIA